MEIIPANPTQANQFIVDTRKIVGISRAYRDQTERSYRANAIIPELTNPMGIAYEGLIQNISNDGISPDTSTRFVTPSFTALIQHINAKREDAQGKGALFAIEIADEKPIDGVGEVLGRTVLVDNLLETPEQRQASTEITTPTLATQLESIRQFPSHIFLYIVDSGSLLDQAN